MIECPGCATQNSDQALVCSMCKRLLGRETQPEAPPPQPGPIHHALPAAARRFRLLMPAGLLLWTALAWLSAAGDPPPLLAPLLAAAHFRLGLGLGGLFLAAYAIGSTIQACGGPFWPGFLYALFPPAIPGVFSHATGRPVWANYAYLLSEIIIACFLLLFYYEHPAAAPGTAALGGVIALAPLFVLQFFGGGLRDLARGLGLDPWRTLAWLGGAPPALALAGLAERRITAGLAPGAVPVWLMLACGFILWTLFVWGRAVHEGLSNGAE